MAKLVKTKIEVEGRVEEEYALVEESRTKPWDIEEELRIVGKPTPRVDGVERVTGAAKYTADIQLPGMLHCKFLRSPHPHARIVAIDTSEAEKIPGVRAIRTLQNTPPIDMGKGELLFGETVRFVGDEVAAVVADSEPIARAAVNKIHVDYEPLPFVLDAEQAAQEDAPRVHPEGNLLGGKPQDDQRGDVVQGFAEADVVVEGVFETPAQLHNPLETHSSVVDWDGQTCTVYDSTQAIENIRISLAERLGMDRNRVRVISKYMGGGFGAKTEVGKHTLLAALVAGQLQRPVRSSLDRREENLVGGYRSPSRQYLRIGSKKDGTLTAIDLKCYYALGAYAEWSPFVRGPMRELYACPNVRTVQFGMFTNTCPFQAFRAPGYVEGTFALESLMDELATKLDMDPLELRIKNYTANSPISGKPYSSKGLFDAYQEGARAIDWSRRARPPEAHGPVRIGIGMASQIWYGSGGPPAYALIKVDSQATATILTATQDLGTGTKTALVQIAAEELNLPLEKIAIEIGDSQAGVVSIGSSGSMTLASMGPPVREAAADAKGQLLDLAASFLSKRKKSLRLENGLVRGPGIEKPLEEILGQVGEVIIIGRGARGPNPSGYEIRTFGAQFAQVAVDIETGEIRVQRIIAAHDSGRIINPLTTSSQVEGGALQGLGFALTEERVLDPATGQVLNGNLEDYLLPTVLDAPDIETHMTDRADNLINNIGAKGVGEPPIVPTAPAIANAIFHATGIRFYRLPITRDRLLDALEERSKEVPPEQA
jgi:xanthine dehydrogenase YagR molybdenum-binding subunit